MLIHLAKLVAVAGALLATSSCATTSSPTKAKTEYQVFVPRGAESYDPTDNQTFLLGDRRGIATLPIYPQTLISRHLATQNICVEIDIDTTGHVADSRPIYATNGCPEQSQRPDDSFLEAATAAVKQWTFSPARICTYPAGVKAITDCGGHDVTIELVPVRLAYMFFFKLDRGSPQVVNHELKRDPHYE